MKLVVTEKNIAAKNISAILADGKPKEDKVYSTPVYRFTHEGDDWVVIGLKGHILEVGFPDRLEYHKRGGWEGVTEDGEVLPAQLPASLPKPPFESKRKPFTATGVELHAWKVPALPYLVYAPLVKTPSEKEIIRSLKNLAAKADSVIIATDFDREGELIGSDAQDMIRMAAPDVPMRRARYSAITKAEITAAFSDAELVDLDQALADAGESRQYIDLIWGAVLTRFLTVVKRTGLANVRSAGRVQTPTLAIIANRERERMDFKPEDYWTIKGSFALGADEFTATHARDRFKVEAEAQAAMAAVEGAREGVVSAVESKQRKVAPPVPFNTTSLQAAAAAEGLSPARTMRIAETLYMNGYTSYPRVDNTVYPASLDLRETVKMLSAVPVYAPFAQNLLKQEKLHATRGKKETTDHPPIYPTGAGDPDKMKPEEWKLYNLIARRFLATLSGPATIQGTKVTIDVAGEPFVVRGDVLENPGFRGIYGYGLKKDEHLPAFEQGGKVDFNGAELAKKQTEPPARYSQGKLIQEMENLGLGTKSTRHSIIERLVEVKYVQNDPLEPTAMGLAVCEALEKFAPHITSPGMTSELEQEMDHIAAGTTSQTEVVTHSRDLLAGIMGELIPQKDDLAEAIADAAAADAYIGKCPKCGHDLLVKSSLRTHSKFVGCSAWPDCDVTYPLPQGKLAVTEELCPICGSPQIQVTPFRGKPHLHCLDPKCESNQEPELFVGKCPTCAAAGRDGDLIAQKSPRTLKRFIRCTNYDECKTSYPLPQNGKLSYEGETCETCGSPVVVVATRRGPWHLCVNMECPSKAEAEEKKAAGKGAARRGSGAAKKTAGTRASSSKKASSSKGKKTAGTKKATGKSE